jgi:23S rRNA (uracil1939-C5)-methyltransferase
MTFGPSAIARVAGKTVMIPGAVPGDVLVIKTQSDKHDYALGSIVHVVRPAPDRRQPPCPYVSRGCGGCDWQHIRYEAQARLKAEVISTEFRHTLGIEVNPEGLIEPAPVEFGYRSRLRLKIGSAGKIGFHHPGSQRFVPVDACLVAAPPLSAAARLASLLGQKCSEIEVVAGPLGEVIVAHLKKAPGAFVRAIACRMIDDGTVAGLIVHGGTVRELFGDIRIACEVESGCVIEADADVFSQVNRAQNLKLVAAVMRLAELRPEMRVLDLYCGIGNFSLPAARRGAHVIGLDHNPPAIEAARSNAERMGLAETQFIMMRAADGVRFLCKSGYRPEVLILDPPRTGAANLIEPMAQIGASKLIYVSCNPSTLVRDLRQLTLRGYKMQVVRGFDFFPNTHHLEMVATLVLT